jgi:hypothetical protein
MPRAAVMDGFNRRGWNPQGLTSDQVFLIAGELGVGYETLLTHLNVVLEVLPDSILKDLHKISPKLIKSALIGKDWAGPLTVVDENWAGVAIDLEVDEYLIAPNSSEGDNELLAVPQSHCGQLIFSAKSSGVGQFKISGRTIELRISRRHYVGPYSNRYLPDPDEH